MKTSRDGRNGGFTLIELLIVIIIIGVLAAVVVFAVGGVTDRGKASACKTNRKQVQVAEEAYYSEFAGYTPIPNLVTQHLLREAPASPDYSFAVDLATGEVTSTPACSAL